MQRCNFFRVGNRTCIVSYSYFRKLHLCTLVFLYLFFRRKITEIDRAVIPSEVVRLESYPPQFSQIWARSPAPLPKTMIEKNKIMILCSICTLIFVSGGRGDAGPDLCQLRSPRGGRLDGFYSVIQKGLFLGPKSREKLDTQIRASPVQDFCHGCCCVKVASSLTFCAHSSLQSFSTSDKMKGPKQARQEGPLSILRGSTFGSLLKYICFAQGSKTGPSVF